MYIPPYDIGFDASQGSSTPLAFPAPSFTNETNTAQSVPLIDRGAAAVNGISQAQVNNFWRPATAPSQGRVDPYVTFIGAATPQNPAAPSPGDTSETSNDAKQANPWVWIGALAVIGVIVWALK